MTHGPEHDTSTAPAAADAMGDEAADRAAALFLDDRNVYGCAETSFVVLKHAFGLPDPDASGTAMALNGGIAYSGATCGAITGCALALGGLADRRIEDHRTAKRVARGLTLRLLTDFEAEFGAVDCRALIGMEIRAPEQHRAFIEGGIWRDRCMRQLEFAVRRLAPLQSPAGWEEAVESLQDEA